MNEARNVGIYGPERYGEILRRPLKLNQGGGVFSTVFSTGIC